MRANVAAVSIFFTTIYNLLPIVTLCAPHALSTRPTPGFGGGRSQREQQNR